MYPQSHTVDQSKMKCSFILLLLAALTSVESAVDITEQNITTLPFLLECRIPEDTSFADNTTHVNLTEEEMNQLLIEGPCFLACLSDGRINSDQVSINFVHAVQGKHYNGSQHCNNFHVESYLF